jgi:hypothetical protein
VGQSSYRHGNGQGCSIKVAERLKLKLRESGVFTMKRDLSRNGQGEKTGAGREQSPGMQND